MTDHKSYILNKGPLSDIETQSVSDVRPLLEMLEFLVIGHGSYQPFNFSGYSTLSTQHPIFILSTPLTGTCSLPHIPSFFLPLLYEMFEVLETQTQDNVIGRLSTLLNKSYSICAQFG